MRAVSGKQQARFGVAFALCNVTDDLVSAVAARFLQRPLAKLISTLRAPKSSEGYKAIGGGSPLRRITEEQAAALAQSLKRRGLAASVYVGMRYWTPFIDDAMEQVCLLCLPERDKEMSRTMIVCEYHDCL